MIGALQRLGGRGEPALAHLHLDLRVVEYVQRPLGSIAGCHEDRAVGLIDVADCDRPREPAPPSPGGESGDLPLEEQVAADVVRQRARCQDLPSVWVDGA